MIGLLPFSQEISCRIYNHINGPKTKDKGTTNSNTTIVIDLNFIFKSTKKKNNTMNERQTRNHVKNFVSFVLFFLKVVIWKAYRNPTKNVKTLSKLYIEKLISNMYLLKFVHKLISHL